MNSQVLTTSQKRVFDFVKQYIDEHSYAPTYEEIATALGFSSKASVNQHVSALEKKGFIRRNPGAMRGLVVYKEEEGYTEIPVKGTTAAGEAIEMVEESEYETVKVPKKLIPRTDRQYFALKVQGDSMLQDGVYDGEVIVVEARQHADNGDLVVVKDMDENVTLKYFYREKNRIRLEPRNDKYKPIYLENCEVLGILKGLTRSVYS